MTRSLLAISPELRPSLPEQPHFVQPALLALTMTLAGCAEQAYRPAQLPLFMSDSTTVAERPMEMPPEQHSLTTDTHHPTVESAATLPKSIGLAEAIAETLNSPALLSAAENVSQASAGLWTASTPPNPTFNVSSTLNPLTRAFTPTRQGGPPQFDAGFSFPIDWLVFGKRSAAMDSARLDTDIAGAVFTDSVRQRLAATVAAFYDVLEAKELLALAEQDADNLRQIAAVTDRQVQLGGIGFIESDRIRLAVLDSEREVQRRKTAVQTAKALLKAALGRNADTPEFDVRGDLQVPAVPAPPSAEEAFRYAEQYRPDIVAARLQIAKAEADVRLEQRKALPQITPSAGYTRQFQENAIGYPDANSWGVGMVMSVPIFDRNQGAIRKADSVVLQARYNLDDRLAALRSEVAERAENFRLAQTFVSSNTRARIATAKSVRDRIEMAYQEGGRSLLEMLDAQRTYRDIARSAVTDQSAYWQSLHRLNAAIGKQILQ